MSHIHTVYACRTGRLPMPSVECYIGLNYIEKQSMLGLVQPGSPLHAEVVAWTAFIVP